MSSFSNNTNIPDDVFNEMAKLNVESTLNNFDKQAFRSKERNELLSQIKKEQISNSATMLQEIHEINCRLELIECNLSIIYDLFNENNESIVEIKQIIIKQNEHKLKEFLADKFSDIAIDAVTSIVMSATKQYLISKGVL